MTPLFRHIAVGVLVSTLAACSSSDDDSGSTTTPDAGPDNGQPGAGDDIGGVAVPPVANTGDAGTVDSGPLNDPTNGAGTATAGTATAGEGTSTTGLTDSDDTTGTATAGTATAGAGTVGDGITDGDDTGTATAGTATVDDGTTTGATDGDETGTATAGDGTTTGVSDGMTDGDGAGTATGGTVTDGEGATTVGMTDGDDSGVTDGMGTTTGTTDPVAGNDGPTAAVPGQATTEGFDAGTGVPVTFIAGEENSCSDRVLSRYVRTLSEVCSLGGPSAVDGNRTDDAPSAPTGLTALLVAEQWAQIDWIPSSDNSEVVAYDIFRNGQLAATVDDDATKRIEAQRYWRTTTYIDCDFTRFFCEAADGGIGRLQPGTTYEYTIVAIDDLGNRSEASAPMSLTTNTVVAGAAPLDPASEGYSVVFGDEFDGTELDTAKWRTSLSFEQFLEDGSVVNGEQQFFVDTRGSNFGFPYDPFKFEGDGTLKIQAVRTADVDLGDRAAEAGGLPYLSGVISSRDKFVEGVRFGYVEMRAKVPSGNGLLSTFFLFQRSANQYEIDILEYLGRVPDGATQNYHYRDGFRFGDNGIRDGGGNSVDGGSQGVAHASPTMQLETGVDLSTDFRVYSVLWEPNSVIWYVDGQEVRRLTGPRVSDVSMDIVAQFVIGSPNFAGDPSAVNFPVSYEIDYIRAWQK